MIKSSRGLWIAFFGPDGIGKSAVIECLEHHLAPAFNGSTHFHFRPHFHKSGRKLPPVTEPHATAPRGTVMSIGKLLFWFMDCWYGYLVAIRSRRRNGGLVIFDRYYPDMLVDPRRYRLPATAIPFARWLSRYTPRPDLYVLLDAPADVVLTRKSELPIAELRRQRIAYPRLFETLHSRLIVTADAAVDEVSRNVSAAILSKETTSLLQACESSIANL